jgi:hypothetical protein
VNVEAELNLFEAGGDFGEDEQDCSVVCLDLIGTRVAWSAKREINRLYSTRLSSPSCHQNNVNIISSLTCINLMNSDWSVYEN